LRIYEILSHFFKPVLRGLRSKFLDDIINPIPDCTYKFGRKVKKE